MKTLQALKLFLDLRKGWGSKSVIFARVAAILSGLDVTWFHGEMGAKIVAGVMKVVSAVPFLPPIDEMQATGVCMFVLSGVVMWLRAKAVVPLADKAN